jgi:hypothetical protein
VVSTWGTGGLQELCTGLDLRVTGGQATMLFLSTYSYSCGQGTRRRKFGYFWNLFIT